MRLAGLVLVLLLGVSGVGAAPVPLADLTVTDIVFSQPLVAGQPVLFEARVLNQGIAASRVMNIAWFLDGNRVGLGSFGELEPGSVKPARSNNVRLNWVAVNGVHSVRYCMDFHNHVKESDESNNCLEKPFEVGGPFLSDKIHPVLREKIRAINPQTRDVPYERVLVRVSDAAAVDSVSLNAGDWSGELREKFGVGKLVSLDVPLTRLNDLAQSSEVRFIYPVEEVRAALSEAVPQMGVPMAWSAGLMGSGVRVAVVDSGIDSTHPMLSGKVVLERNFSSASTVGDVLGHGTHVAGIVAGKEWNGLSGVAPEALLVNAKVLDDSGTGSSESVIAGINWVLDPDGNPLTDDGAKIINLSLGSFSSDVNSP
ncbi:MAG: S8 family serine peptidase, partial [Candidatus Diapherotrites archaeon]|nr:S8 family serine peptidase [Candidatus Diapherotrites archaeon]